MSRSTQTVWLLGLTQIIGYGTLYYSFSILAAGISASFGWTEADFFGVFSLSLLTGAFASPWAGRALDRFGAARMMAIGSVVCAVALAVAAATGSGITFTVALVVMQLASALVFYDAAFPAVVQVSQGDGPRRIVHLTLIAGFASSIFWPLTSFLYDALDWRNVLGLYAVANLFVCLPVHVWVARLARCSDEKPVDLPTISKPPVEHATVPPEQLGRAMALVTLGFSLSGFALSAVLSQMVPMLTALGFGAGALAVSTLFGPAQVAVRFTSLVFGAGRHPLTIAIVALALLPVALIVATVSTPAYLGAVVFVVLVGLCSGLKSIVQGTVPLALFGAGNFGARLGFMASFRHALAALAPFAFAFTSEHASAATAVMAFAAIAVLGVVALVAVAGMVRHIAVTTATSEPLHL